MKILIIEDEPFAQQELIRLLKACDSSIEVLACIDSVKESEIWLRENKEAELIFMDIQLSDGISFELFNKMEVEIPVIFTTAYDEYAIKAFKVNSIDYLLKPIEEEELNQSLKKYRSLKKSTSDSAILSSEQLEEVMGLFKEPFKKRLVARIGDSIIHIDVNKIAYIYSEEKVTFLITKDKKRYIINYTLEQLEQLLNPDDFHRLNRKYITHIDAINKINKYFNSRLKINLEPEAEDEILISRAKVQGFIDWLEK